MIHGHLRQVRTRGRKRGSACETQRTDGLAYLYVEQSHVLLPLVHVAFSHPTLRLRAGKRDLDHMEVVHRQTLDKLRVGAIQAFEQLCSERGRVPVTSEELLIAKKQIDGHPEGTGVLGTHVAAD